MKPGFVDTPMTAAFPKGALWASADTVAAGIVRAMESGAGEVYLPWFWWPIMFVIRHLPWFDLLAAEDLAARLRAGEAGRGSQSRSQRPSPFRRYSTKARW